MRSASTGGDAFALMRERLGTAAGALEMGVSFGSLGPLHGSILSEAVRRRSIESEVRFKLHALLTQKRISFPFPQRDVHLHSQKPIEVRVTKMDARPKGPIS